MGGVRLKLSNFFKGKNAKFVSEKAFKSNLKKQIESIPQVLAELKKHGTDEIREQKLEYFFYTDTAEKAKALSTELQNKNYTVTYKISSYDDKTYVITGWTSKIKLEQESIVNWSREMCELGYKYDCDYDGWGTDVNQDSNV
jgi:regulator of RNase E activity RraB